MNQEKSKKIVDLEKKQVKLETEVENAKKKLADQQAITERKVEELNRIQSEIVSQLLVENGLTIPELTSFVLEAKKNKELSSTLSNSNHVAMRGEDHV